MDSNGQKSIDSEHNKNFQTQNLWQYTVIVPSVE